MDYLLQTASSVRLISSFPACLILEWVSFTIGCEWESVGGSVKQWGDDSGGLGGIALGINISKKLPSDVEVSSPGNQNWASRMSGLNWLWWILLSSLSLSQTPYVDSKVILKGRAEGRRGAYYYLCSLELKTKLQVGCDFYTVCLLQVLLGDKWTWTFFFQQS